VIDKESSMLETRFIFRTVAILICISFCTSSEFANLSAQPPKKSLAMTKEEVLEMATLITALKKEYAMIDQDPDSDFLIFTQEDDELEFFPKRDLPKRMEALGLLLNKGEIDPVHHPSQHMEWDDNTKSWNVITSQGWIIYLYEVTAKGKEFLRNAPKTLGHAVPPLKMATEESVERHQRMKTIRVKTYDQTALLKMHDDFVQISKDLIKALFAYAAGQESAEVPDGMTCGPKLWGKLETLAIKNGVHKGELRIIGSYSTHSGPGGSIEGVRPGSVITSQQQVGLFVKTLTQVFPIGGEVSIRVLSETESVPYRDPWEFMFPVSPMFMPSMITAAFSVEYGGMHLVIKSRNDPRYEFMKISPKISSIELF